MPPVTAQVGDTYQVRVVGRQEGQATNNIFYFTAASAVDDVELRLVKALAECFVTVLIPALSSAWSLEKLQWQQVRPTLSPLFETIPTGTLQGGGPANALPTTCSAVVSVLTAQGGRSHRGRFSLCGIPEPSTANSILDANAALWVALAAFVACVAGKFFVGDPPGANSFQMQLYSRKIGGSHFPLGANGFTPVTQLVPKNVIGTIRSRKLRPSS